MRQGTEFPWEVVESQLSEPRRNERYIQIKLLTIATRFTLLSIQ